MLCYVCSTMVTLLKVTDAPIQFCDILVLTLYFRLINVSCQIFHPTLVWIL
jgi:hypothetical protein